MSKNGSPLKKIPYQGSPDDIILKIIYHSKNEPSPKFLKYILHAKKAFTSSDLRLWMDLRTKGGLDAIQAVVRKLETELGELENLNNEDISISKEDICFCPFKLSKVKKDIVASSLSFLGNAFSLDYAARKEVASNGFIEVLHKFIQRYILCIPPNQLENGNTESEKKIKSCLGIDIITRAVKCVANLAHDSEAREVILKSGVGISIIKVIENYNQNFGKPKANHIDRKKDAPEQYTKNYMNQGHRECIRSCIRAIRILSSEPFCSEEARIHLIRFGSVIGIGKVLTWCGEDSSQDLTLDIVKAIISLTDRIRLLPSDQIVELVSEEMENDTLKKLVELFKNNHHEEKLFSPVVRCLTNLSCNAHVAESLGRLQIFRIGLDKLKQTSVKASSEICRLMVTLTKHSSVNQCVLHNCQEIWSTINILRSSELSEYHRWVLHVYENVYERSLKSLLQNGLMELIHDHLKEELEEIDYEILIRKIISLEDDTCKVHSCNNECSFTPVYRCDSPLYQQVQEEVKVFLKDREIHNKVDNESGSSGVESSSPSTSPARSWTSEDSFITDNSSSDRVKSSSSSEDEGCCSPVYSFSSSPSYSQGTVADLDLSEDDESQAKRIKLNNGQYSIGNGSRHKMCSKKSSDHIKVKSKKKIVTMLSILQKCTYLSPMPMSLMQVVPIFLSVLVRGIVSLTPNRDNYEQQNQEDVESMTLGRQSYSLAYRILKTMCLNINMFPDFVQNGTVNILYRLLTWDKLLDQLGNTQNVRNLLNTLSGASNNTAGWREGYILRTLLISKCEEEINRLAFAVPLLFKKNDLVLRNFESKGQSWSRVFYLLTKTDEITFSKFQDCILSVATLCETIGMNWIETVEETRSRPLLWTSKHSDMDRVMNITYFSEEILIPFDTKSDNSRVEILLDNGTRAKIPKDILTKSSPVFSAMFDGHFVESGERKVSIRGITNNAIKALTEQLFLQNACTSESENDTESVIENNKYNLSTLFELLSLSDQFLLESIYERTLNTLLRLYICPYSSPIIYEEAVKRSALLKPLKVKGWDLDLNFLVLKYLLVGDMSMNCKCVAFRKIFESVSPLVVVGDIKALVKYYSTRPQNPVNR